MIAIPRDAFYAVNPFSLGTYRVVCLLLLVAHRLLRDSNIFTKNLDPPESKRACCYMMCWFVAIIAFFVGIFVAGVVAAIMYGSRLPSEGFLLQCRCDDDCQLSPLPQNDDQDIEMCSIYRVTCDTAEKGYIDRFDSNSTSTLLAKFEFTYRRGRDRYDFYTQDDNGGPCLLWKSEEFDEINRGHKLDHELFGWNDNFTVVSPFTAEALRERSPLSVADFVALEDEGLFRPEMMGLGRAEQRLRQGEVARKWALACAVGVFPLLIVGVCLLIVIFDEFRVLLALLFVVCYLSVVGARCFGQ